MACHWRVISVDDPARANNGGKALFRCEWFVIYSPYKVPSVGRAGWTTRGKGGPRAAHVSEIMRSVTAWGKDANRHRQDWPPYSRRASHAFKLVRIEIRFCTNSPRPCTPYTHDRVVPWQWVESFPKVPGDQHSRMVYRPPTKPILGCAAWAGYASEVVYGAATAHSHGFEFVRRSSPCNRYRWGIFRRGCSRRRSEIVRYSD